MIVSENDVIVVRMMYNDGRSITTSEGVHGRGYRWMRKTAGGWVPQAMPRGLTLERCEQIAKTEERYYLVDPDGAIQ